MANLKLARRVKDNTFKHYLIYSKHYYLGSYERALSDLNAYFENATPEAIVQMRKRLLVKNRWEHGVMHLMKLY